MKNHGWHLLNCTQKVRHKTFGVQFSITAAPVLPIICGFLVEIVPEIYL